MGIFENLPNFSENIQKHFFGLWSTFEGSLESVLNSSENQKRCYVINKNNNTWLHRGRILISSRVQRYNFISLLMYQVEHSKKNPISTHAHELFSPHCEEKFIVN